MRSITSQESSGGKVYECNICKDIEWIQTDDGYKPCKCREIKRYKRILENSGISEGFRSKTLENFETKNRPKVIKRAKEEASGYINNFESENSIAFIGAIGCGKTHLAASISNVLMSTGVAVLYVNYRDMVNKLKQTVTDEENYGREMDKYKNVSVLFIDDLFKGMNDADVKYIYEVINFRYFNSKRMIITSEKNVDEWLAIDAAVGSRLYEMCKGKIVEFTGKDLNYRLR